MESSITNWYTRTGRVCPEKRKGQQDNVRILARTPQRLEGTHRYGALDRMPDLERPRSTKDPSIDGTNRWPRHVRPLLDNPQATSHTITDEL